MLIDPERCCFCNEKASGICRNCIPEWAGIRTDSKIVFMNGMIKTMALFTRRKVILRCHDGQIHMLVNNVPGDFLFQIRYRIRRWKYSLLYPFIDLFIVPNHSVEEKLANHFQLKGSYRKEKIQYIRQGNHHNLKKFPKYGHEGINILYYYPLYHNNFPLKEWMYGVDEYRKAKKEIKDVNWIVVRGECDMSALFPIVDIFFNPKPLRSISRLEDESRLNSINIAKNIEELRNLVIDGSK